MLTLDEVIAQRRSIRAFTSQKIRDEDIEAILEAARLAPSGCNMQPWRFKIVDDTATKEKIVAACYEQKFIGEAPVVIVCCADIGPYARGTLPAATNYGRQGATEESALRRIYKKVRAEQELEAADFVPGILVNLAIAVEHMVLKAVDLGMGSCWIRLLDEEALRHLFGWNRDLLVFAVLPIGYPKKIPPAKKRLPRERILLD